MKYLEVLELKWLKMILTGLGIHTHYYLSNTINYKIRLKYTLLKKIKK